MPQRDELQSMIKMIVPTLFYWSTFPGIDITEKAKTWNLKFCGNVPHDSMSLHNNHLPGVIDRNSCCCI